MNKLTQAEIDELAKDSDEEQEPQYSQDFQQNAVQEEYPQDEQMNEQMNQEIASQQPEEQYKIQDVPQVQSEIASQNMDEVMSENVANSDFQFKKDQDLSEAQSEFIESSRLNDGGIIKIKSNIKSQASNQHSKPKTNENKKPKTADPKQKPKVVNKPAAKPKKPVVAKQPQKAKTEEESKREKLSESEIARRMKEIEQSKRQMQKKKEERAKKDEQARRKEYEQAKQKEQERKQKNKRIFEQQQKAKKKPVSAAPSVKAQQEQIKIPQKRSDFRYMQQKKQRMMNEKQIQKKIEQQNIQKLKRLNENQPKQLKGQAKKQAIIDQRNYQLQRQKKQRKKEEQTGDVFIIKQLKQEIMECKRFNLEKNQQINRAEKNIGILNKKVKEKEKILYDADTKADNNKQEPIYDDLSDLSPVEKFVHSFPQTKTVDEIFTMIDSNGDGVLSTAQIHQKLSQFGLSKQIIDRVQEVLDQNNDGTVSRQQFVFLVELQIKRQRDYRQILGDISIANPLDLQARIIDMQAKLKYINKQLEAHRNSNEDEAYQNKIDALSRKVDKIEAKKRKEMTDLVQEGRGDIPANTMAHLTNEYVRLRNDKTIRVNFLQKLRRRVKQNLAEKNKLLASRVEQGLRLQQQLYKIKNDIQQRQLRFLSMKKIEQNKRGYVQRQTQKRKEMEQAYKRTKQYEVLITDPSKKAQNNALAEEMKFLAAVLMIQRNYRKRKARGEFQRLKQEAK